MIRKLTAILILFVLLLAKVASIHAASIDHKENKAVTEQGTEAEKDQADEEKKNERTEIDDFIHESPLAFATPLAKVCNYSSIFHGVKIVHLSLPHPPPDHFS